MRISDWSSDVFSSVLDVEADGVDEAGLDLRRDRLPEIGKLAGKLALDLGPGQLALEGPQAAGAVGDDVAVRRREGDRRRLGLLARQPLGHYRGAPRRAGIDDAPGGHAGIVRRRPVEGAVARLRSGRPLDRKSTRLNSSH